MTKPDSTVEHPPHDPLEQARRWRLILGRYADKNLQQANLSGQQLQLERSLDFLYQHEYKRRGIHQHQHRHGSLDASQLTAINWLNQSRKLFPKSTFERMQKQAIERYQMSHLLKSPEHIQQLDPSPEIAKALLSMRGQLNAEMRTAIKNLITQVVADMLEKIRPRFLQTIQGRRHRFKRSHIKQSQNFDWRRTIALNLKHYQPSLQQLIIQQPVFNARVQQHLPWEIVLCVDQSGSMMDSVMYAAICASILAALPAVTTHLVLFDTQVVDLTHLAHDPVEILLTIQLGGGTNIAQAMHYCAQKITQPQRSIFILISDFEEGGSIQDMLRVTAQLNEQGCRLLGLAALDQAAHPVYDKNTAQQLQQRGMQVAAMTPEHLADWFAEVMQ
ncbi:VWA domain-containing protein [Acinetobacter qingfengensis]|uniref:VWA containing CoxE family protein n=1 Tax=Acinetobacter qingfengensis TaxID=1262585 RepID=A0A1E7RCI6_9GAMM|nr:VWA domain-containing protein [Acinetobacter qingfengensis]KAA8734320.1 VWA domain-containing protein [Acinetobacter qingfengensis]OEY97084.1 VWA containing CoxE family protein [Acinetobacter qingfengensis]